MLNRSVVALKPVQVMTPLISGTGNALTEGVLVSDNGTTAMVRIKGRSIPTPYPSSAVRLVSAVRNVKRIPRCVNGSGSGAFVNLLNK